MKNEEPLSSPLSEQQRVGEQLKQLRQDKSLTLDDVAVSTKISQSNLRAIESMAYDKLPADTFTRGQIILYGSFLGMDGRLAADQFFTERDGGKKPFISSLQKSLNHQSLTPKKLAEPTHVSSAIIAGILLLLIVFSFTGFCLYFSWNPFAFLTGRTFNLTSSPNNIFHPADPATSNGSTHKQLKLSALFKKDSRVLISLDNKQSFEQQYTLGTSAHWEAEKQLQLEFLQPDSAELHLNGSPLPFPDGAAGHYKLRIPPHAPSAP
jgi:cytoskeleton protein RodZ